MFCETFPNWNDVLLTEMTNTNQGKTRWKPTVHCSWFIELSGYSVFALTCIKYVKREFAKAKLIPLKLRLLFSPVQVWNTTNTLLIYKVLWTFTNKVLRVWKLKLHTSCRHLSITIRSRAKLFQKWQEALYFEKWEKITFTICFGYICTCFHFMIKKKRLGRMTAV